MINFPIRTLAGIGSEPNIAQTYSYLKKIISSDSDNKFKAMAHAFIVRSTFVGPQTIPQTSSGMVKAAFHANAAARLGLGGAPVVLYFGKKAKDTMQRYSATLRNKTYLWEAVRARDEEFAREEMLKRNVRRNPTGISARR